MVPWYQTSLVWDAVTTGGAGLTAPVFYAIGNTEEQVIDKADPTAPKRTVLSGLALVGGSAAGGLMGYGLYGALRDHGMNSWKAGALTGLLGGITTAGVLVALSLITGRPLVPPLKKKEV